MSPTPLFKPASRASKHCYFEDSELFRITEHDSLGAELRTDGDKWAWLDSPSTAGSCTRESTLSSSGRWTEGGIYRMSGHALCWKLCSVIPRNSPPWILYEQGNQLFSDSGGQSSQAQGQFLQDNKESELLSVLSSWQLPNSPDSVVCIEYHVPEQVVTKQLCPPVKA